MIEREIDGARKTKSVYRLMENAMFNAHKKTRNTEYNAMALKESVKKRTQNKRMVENYISSLHRHYTHRIFFLADISLYIGFFTRWFVFFISFALLSTQHLCTNPGHSFEVLLLLSAH